MLNHIWAALLFIGILVAGLTGHVSGEGSVLDAAAKASEKAIMGIALPLAGMMIHQDASTHRWVPNAIWDLVVTLDDATSEHTSMFFCAQEGTNSSFHGLGQTMARYGLFASLYSDRGSHYFETPAAGGRVSKTALTQVGRALKRLGIEHIAAYSPQARGRSERAFSTLQDRLVKELALARITTVADANRWLSEVYMPEHNKRFAVPAEDAGSAFVRDPTGAWRDALCVQEERVVGNDNTLKWRKATTCFPNWRANSATG